MSVPSGGCFSPHSSLATLIHVTLSRNFPFERINSLQCYELTRRYSHLLFTQISPLTYAVYLWPVHCECAMKHNRRRIFNYLRIRDMFIAICHCTDRICTSITVSLGGSIFSLRISGWTPEVLLSSFAVQTQGGLRGVNSW